MRPDETDSEAEQANIQPHIALCSDSKIGHLTDSESSRQVGSTLAEALNPAAQYSFPEDSDRSSTITPDKLPVEDKILQLGGRIRALIKEYFAGNEPSSLPQGHPTIAFTEGQICNVLKRVADETARASYDMLEKLIHRASQLSLTSEPVAGKSTKKSIARRGSSKTSSREQYQESTSGGYSESSGAIRSDVDFASIGYSFEYSEPDIIAGPTQSSAQPSSSQLESGSPSVSCSVESLGAQTLASLKQEC